MLKEFAEISSSIIASNDYKNFDSAEAQTHINVINSFFGEPAAKAADKNYAAYIDAIRSMKEEEERKLKAEKERKRKEEERRRQEEERKKLEAEEAERRRKAEAARKQREEEERKRKEEEHRRQEEARKKREAAEAERRRKAEEARKQREEEARKRKEEEERRRREEEERIRREEAEQKEIPILLVRIEKEGASSEYDRLRFRTLNYAKSSKRYKIDMEDFENRWNKAKAMVDAAERAAENREVTKLNTISALVGFIPVLLIGFIYHLLPMLFELPSDLAWFLGWSKIVPYISLVTLIMPLVLLIEGFFVLVGAKSGNFESSETLRWISYGTVIGVACILGLAVVIKLAVLLIMFLIDAIIAIAIFIWDAIVAIALFIWNGILGIGTFLLEGFNVVAVFLINGFFGVIGSIFTFLWEAIVFIFNILVFAIGGILTFLWDAAIFILQFLLGGAINILVMILTAIFN